MSTPERKTLRILCLIGATEKAAFNGIRSLIVLFSTRQLAFSDGKAFELYASMMAMGYLAPLFGGYLVDRFLGIRRVVQWGMALLFLGVTVLFVSSSGSLYPALALIVVGGGLVKAGIPTAVGKLPEEAGASADSRFALLYTFFNVGTLIGIIGCAVLGEVLGWRLGFGVAAAVMLLGAPLVLGLNVADDKARSPVAGGLVILCCMGVLTLLFYDANALKPLMGLGMIGAFALLVRVGLRHSPRGTLKLFTLMALHALFFAFYEQAGLSLNLFAERNIDRQWGALFPGLGATAIPVLFFQSVDPLLSVILGSAFVAIWAMLEARGRAPSIWMKFGGGLILSACAFLLLSAAPVAGGKISPWMLIGTYFLFVVAEQLMVPTGFSAVKELAPRNRLGFYIGCWFLSISGSEWLAAFLSRFTAEAGAAGLFATESVLIYQDVFRKFALAAGAVGLALLLARLLCLRLPRKLRPDAVLVDDDSLVHVTWQIAADYQGKSLIAFSQPEAFLSEIAKYDRRTAVFIDSNLGNGVRGENVAAELHDAGFENLFLATGHHHQVRIGSPSFVRGVVGKEPPWL